MADKIVWSKAPGRDRQFGSIGKLQLFILGPDTKLGADPGDYRLFIYFPTEVNPVGGDGTRVASEVAGKQYAEELFREFHQKLTTALRPAVKKARVTK
ncbi:hypothetical protein [Streptomyces atratus]|uniref:hypothetical protein n=1 Tax=Streptomyces atratus TaxID=1893 RepID=UPI00364F1E06